MASVAIGALIGAVIGFGLGLGTNVTGLVLAGYGLFSGLLLGGLIWIVRHQRARRGTHSG